MERLGDRLGNLHGLVLEDQYRRKAPAYFGQVIRRAHALSHEDLDALLDTFVERNVLSLEEKQDLMLVDLVVQGRRDDDDVFLAVEVSSIIVQSDVKRAAHRAALLGKVGKALPFVAGADVAPDASQEAEDLGVWRILDGRVLSPAGAG